MPYRFARSTTGNSANGSTNWGDATDTLVNLMADMVAGDTGYVSQAHNESSAAPIIILPGTPAAPVKIICVSDAAETPDTLSTAGVVTATGSLTIQGNGYIRGLKIRGGNGSVSAHSIVLGSGTTNANQSLDNCELHLMTTGTGLANIQVGDATRSDASQYTWRNVGVKLAGVNQRMIINGNVFQWNGGYMVAGTTVPVNLFQLGARAYADFRVNNVDFTLAGSAVGISVLPSGGNAFVARLSKCLFAAGWDTGGKLFSAVPGAPGQRIEVVNSYAGTVKIRFWAQDWAGVARDNVTVYRTGGAQDAAAGYSMKLQSTADAEFPHLPLAVNLAGFADTTESQTWTFHIIHDAQGSGAGGALQNHEFGLRLSAPGVIIEKFKLDPIPTNASADLDPSSATWTTSGITTPVKQQVSVTFTPSAIGPVDITAMLFAASKTVYLCTRPVKV